MEDLDIDVEEIKGNLKSVLFFKNFEKKFVKDLDLLGPVGIALALGFIMTLVILLNAATEVYFRIHLWISHDGKLPGLSRSQPGRQEQLLLALPYSQYPWLLADAYILPRFDRCRAQHGVGQTDQEPDRHGDSHFLCRLVDSNCHEAHQHCNSL